jgi:hypothetical protein
MIETSTQARLILAELGPDVEIVSPEGMQIGESVPVPAAAMGRWINVGSGPDQDLILRDQPAGIRRAHCRMTFRDGAYRIQGRLHPLGYVLNGEHFIDCTPRPLKDGDLIRIGKHATFRFETGKSAD